MRHFNKIFFITFCFIAVNVNAQDKNFFFQMKKSVKRADILFDLHAYQKAALLYRQALHKRKYRTHALFRLAESYRYLNHIKEAEEIYDKIKLDSLDDSYHHLHYAEILLSNGKLEEANKWFEFYQDTTHIDRVANKKNAIKDYSLFYSDSSGFKLFEVGINSQEPELFPVLYNNGIVFSSSRPSYTPIKIQNGHYDAPFLNLYFSKFKTDTSVAKPSLLKVMQNSLHEGPISFYDNENKAVYSLNLNNSFGSKNLQQLGLFFAEKNRATNEWFTKGAFPYNSNSYSISHPHYNKKNGVLYFVSDMPGGKGGTDIYTSTFENGKWNKPVNFSALNTSGNEMFPFVDEEGAIYFSSNGHPGMGGLDILKYKTNDSIPENVGHPINSAKDDFGLVISNNGKLGFFCSNRKHGKLDDDIYGVKIYGSSIEFTVKDQLKGNYLKNVRVKITDLETNKSLIVSNGSGHIINFKAKPNKKYKADFIKRDYKVEKIEFQEGQLSGLQRKVVFLEKSHKSYVKGKVKIGNKVFPNCNIRVLDFHADTLEKLQANTKGEFRCQINDDTTNLFLAERDSLFGLYRFEPQHKKVGSYGMTYFTIEMEEINMKSIKGALVDTNNISLPNYQLYLKNELTDQIKSFTTDKLGEFNLDVWEIGKYAILRKENGYYQTLTTIFPVVIENIKVKINSLK